MRLDHVLLAVADLDAATDDFRERLGLSAAVGGVHPGRGTHNSLVQLGTAYLELIGVNEPSSPRAQGLLRFLEDGDGPYTFALAVDDLGRAADNLRGRGLAVGAPADGSRRTPEGVLLRWRSAELLPGQAGPGPESPPLPFLIQWADDEPGRAWMGARVERATHAGPWGRVLALLIATERPGELADEYERLFGWRLRGPGGETEVELEMPGGDAVNPTLGPAPLVRLVRPGGREDPAGALLDRAARARLARAGAGFFGLAVEASGPDPVGALRGRGVGVVASPDGRRAAVEPGDGHGLFFELVT